MRGKKELAYTPDCVESLEEGQVFVFGSNLVGCHSGGASAMAMQRFGAVWGQAEGQQGKCYAIPVDIRGEAVGSVSNYMKRHIDKFLTYAKEHTEQVFLVTRIGCGAAGFEENFMAPFFKEALDMENVILPKSFITVLGKETEDTESNGTQRVFNLIILDESGSMSTIEKQAVSGLNETLQTIASAQKEHLEQQHYISFVTFNSQRIRKVMDCVVVDGSQRMRWSDYKPDDCTPLFDAMGQSLTELKHHVSEDDVVLVTIITDGMENASREFSGHDIKRLVAELRAKGWVFAYIGTNQDVDAVADDMGIRHRMSYDYSPTGACDMFATENQSRRIMLSRLSREGSRFLRDEDYDYFNDNEQEIENHEGTGESTIQQEPTDPNSEKEKDNKTEGLWSKIKNSIKR